MSDVIGVAATDEIVAQMYNEYFEQETFKSDVAKAVCLYAVTITKLELLRTNFTLNAGEAFI
eukprot:scaffold27294_cov80-Skeletonema_marinoi.AAC.1